MADSSLKPPKALKRKLCFVIGPIGSEDSDVRIHADWLLEEIIQPVMATFLEYDEPKRADQDHRPGLIDAQLINDLLTADLVIADLSGLNPNAFYEIGIRHMAQKPIIHMQLADEKIPFDLSLYRAIKFSFEWPKDIRAAREALQRSIEAIDADGYQIENPVTNARGIVKLEEHATPKEKVLIDQIDSLIAKLNEYSTPKPSTALIDEIESLSRRVSSIERSKSPHSSQPIAPHSNFDERQYHIAFPESISDREALETKLKNIPIVQSRHSGNQLTILIKGQFAAALEEALSHFGAQYSMTELEA